MENYFHQFSINQTLTVNALIYDCCHVSSTEEKKKHVAYKHSICMQSEWDGDEVEARCGGMTHPKASVSPTKTLNDQQLAFFSTPVLMEWVCMNKWHLKRRMAECNSTVSPFVFWFFFWAPAILFRLADHLWRRHFCDSDEYKTRKCVTFGWIETLFKQVSYICCKSFVLWIG